MEAVAQVAEVTRWDSGFGDTQGGIRIGPKGSERSYLWLPRTARAVDVLRL